MHRKIHLYLPLFIPVLLCAIWTYLAFNYGIENGKTLTFTIITYLITIAWLICCIKTKHFNVWWLLVSFLLSPIPICIYEYHGSGFLPFIGTGLVSMLYAIPFFIISAIIATVFTVSAYKKADSPTNSY